MIFIFMEKIDNEIGGVALLLKTGKTNHIQQETSIYFSMRIRVSLLHCTTLFFLQLRQRPGLSQF